MTKIKRKLFTVFLCLVGVGLSLTLDISSGFAQPEVITYGQGAWSRSDSFIALFDMSPAKNTIHIFTHNLDFVITLHLTDLPDEVRQVDAYELAWSPDSTKLAAVFYATDYDLFNETHIVVWETQFWTETLRLKNSGLYVSWSPDGNYLATGSRIYDATTGEAVHKLGDFFRISYVVWHPTDANQVLLGFDANIQVYDIATGKSLVNYPYYFSNEPAFSPDGRYLAFEQSGDGKAVDILDTSTYELFTSLAYEGSLAEYDGIHWVGNDSIALRRIYEPPIRIININTGEVVDTVSIDSGNIWNNSGYRFLARGSALIDNQPSLAVFDTYNEEVVAQFVLPSASMNIPAPASVQLTHIPLGRAAWSPDGQFIAAFNTEPNINEVIIFTSDLHPVTSLQLGKSLGDLKWADARELEWSPDGSALATLFIVERTVGEYRPYTTIWDAETWTERFSASYQGFQISWSPSRDYLVVDSSIVDAMTGTVVNSLGYFFRLHWVVWHPTDENQLVLGFDLDINVVQPFTGEVLATYPHSGLFVPRFSPDGRYLAVENGDREGFVVDIVDTSTYKRVGTVEPTGSLGEPYGIFWLGNDELGLFTVDTPFTIWNPFTQEIVDTVSIGSSAWHPQGTQALSRTTPLNNPFGRPPLSVYDRETEGIVAQLSTQNTARKLSLTDQAGSPLRALLSGTGIINDISSDEAADGLIEAFTYPEEVGSIAFDLNGTVTIDNAAPYTLPLPSVGTYTLSATPYREADAHGDAGLAFTVVFRVGEDTGEAISTPTVRPTP